MWPQHLCLDKAYNFKSEEQDLIKRDYVLHVPWKRRKPQQIRDKIKAKHQRKKYFSLKKMVYRKNQFMAQQV